MKFANFAAVAAVAVISAAAMPAQAVGYSEGVDVDVFTSAVDAAGQPTRTLFNLEAGANVFTGGVFSPDDTGDYIPLSLGSGLTITSLSIALSNTQFLLSSPQIFFSDLFGNVIYDGALADLDLSLNLGANFYGLFLGNGITGTDYTVTFNVTGPVVVPPTPSVPEPGTWAMMIGGFALAGAAIRRRKAVVSFA